MIYIEHRKNSIESLTTVDISHGVEIDLRTKDNQIILAHDPFTNGDLLEEWIVSFKKLCFTGPLLLNTKEDGLESEIIKILNTHHISNFLFLDTSFPTLIKQLPMNGLNFLLRLSQYEHLEVAQQFIGKIQWLWVDCFNGEPLNEQILQNASIHFKLCMVSPELQGYIIEEKLNNFLEVKKYFSAICTKYPAIWQNHL